jgi:hypothetical protein
MSGRKIAVLAIWITSVPALVGLGFAAMSTNASFIIPHWVPYFFFYLSGADLIAFIIWLLFPILKRLNLKQIKRRKMITAFGILFIIIGVGMVLLGQLNHKVQSSTTTQTTASISQNLIKEINDFLADRNLNRPKVSTSIQTQDDLYKSWQQSVAYSDETNYIFTTTYRQRVIDLAYQFNRLGIITQDELKELEWFVQPDYPSTDWALQDLEKFNSRLPSNSSLAIPSTPITPTSPPTSSISKALTFVDESQISPDQIVVLSLGTNINSCKWSYLKSGNILPPLLSGFDIGVGEEFGRLFVNASVYNPLDKSTPIKVTRNSVSVTPPNWDKNYDDGAFEVVNDKGDPVFQVIYMSPFYVVVNGIFPQPNGGVSWVSDNDVRGVDPFHTSEVFKLNPIFRYPSSLFPSVRK